MSEINVQPFDFDNYVETRRYFTALFTGRRNTGKSVLMKDVIYRLHKAGLERIVVFSATEGSNHYYESFVPSLFIHTGLDLDVLSGIVDHQKQLVTLQAMGEIPKEQDISLVIVLDDVAYDKKSINSEILKQIFFNGRHLHITLLLSLQYLLTLSVPLRSNIDIALFLKEPSIDNRKRIYNSFGSCVSIGAFNTIMQCCTNDYEALVCDTRGMEAESCFHYYKANVELDFKFGTAEAWQLSKKLYFSEEDKYRRMLGLKKTPNTRTLRIG